MRKLRSGGIFDLSILENKSGFISFLVEGDGAKKLFENEAGGHRWQTVSPTDKRSRIHTSTVTVAVLEDDRSSFDVDNNDIEYIMTKGTGPGGQHRNKTESCVTAIHKPTGLSVRIDAKHQNKNKVLATRILIERVAEQSRQQYTKKTSSKRKAQIGSGMRGDKIRTYRSKDDRVVDHVTGEKWKLKKWMRGDW